MSDTEALVYVDLAGAPVLVGRLWSRAPKGRASATFEYDKTWLEHPERFALEPALTLGPGPQHTEAGKALFGALGDSAPDRWRRAPGRSTGRPPRARAAGNRFSPDGRRQGEAGRAAFRAAAGRALSRARGGGTHSACGQPSAAARGIRAGRR